MKFKEYEKFLKNLLSQEIDDGIIDPKNGDDLYTMEDGIIKHQQLYVKQHSRRFYDILNFAPKLSKNSRIIEFGGGPGHLSVSFKKLVGCEVYISDLKEPLEFWKERYNNHGIKSFEFNLLSNKMVDENIGKFDLILLSEVLEHLYRPAHEIINLVKNSLKPNGMILITTPNIASLRHIYNLFTGKSVIPTYEEIFSQKGTTNSPHVKEYEKNELLHEIEKSDLTSLNFKYNDCWDKFDMSKPILSTLRKLIIQIKPRLMSNMMVLLISSS